MHILFLQHILFLRIPRKMSALICDASPDPPPSASAAGSFHEDPDYEPMADFKPVVALPEEVELRTGEEGDTLLYTGRCKLFRLTDGEWKERGVGELRVLHREDDGRVRVVMHRDQVRRYARLEV